MFDAIVEYNELIRESTGDSGTTETVVTASLPVKVNGDLPSIP
jgi:hypothetical protein